MARADFVRSVETVVRARVESGSTEKHWRRRIRIRFGLRQHEHCRQDREEQRYYETSECCSSIHQNIGSNGITGIASGVSVGKP